MWPGVVMLNGSAVTDKERLLAERFFLNLHFAV